MKTKNAVLLFTAAFIWGTAFVAQSVGAEYVPALAFNAARSIIAFVFLLILCLILRQVRRSRGKPATSTRSRKDLLTGGFCCGTALALASFFQQKGLETTSSGKAGFITACYIIIVPVIGIFHKKKCSPFIWIAVILSLCGLYLLCLTPGEGFAIGKGELLVLICAVLFSLHILVIDHFSPLVDGVKMSCIQFLVCGILSGLPALLFESPDLAGILAAKVPILYAGVMSCGVAYTLQIIGQKNMNPTVASLILSLESCISVLAGWILLGQKLSIKEIIGCVIMFCAIVLAQLPQKKSMLLRRA